MWMLLDVSWARYSSHQSHMGHEFKISSKFGCFWVWEHVVSGWRSMVPWILGLIRSWNWLAYYKVLQQHTAAVNVLILCLGNINDGTSPSGFLKAQTWWVQSSQNTQLQKEQVVNFWVCRYSFSVREYGIFVFSFIAMNVWIWWKGSFFVCFSLLESRGGYFNWLCLHQIKADHFHCFIHFFLWWFCPSHKCGWIKRGIWESGSKHEDWPHMVSLAS